MPDGNASQSTFLNRKCCILLLLLFIYYLFLSSFIIMWRNAKVQIEPRSVNILTSSLWENIKSIFSIIIHKQHFTKVVQLYADSLFDDFSKVAESGQPQVNKAIHADCAAALKEWVYSIMRLLYGCIRFCQIAYSFCT